MGIVVKGKQEARAFGFPTANIHTIDENEPGIFFGKADHHPAVIYVPKSNPTRIESHLLNVHGVDLYGKDIDVHIICKIRDDRQFECLDDTIEQIMIDVKIANVLAVMSNLPRRVALSFSGGKEASLLLHCMYMLSMKPDVIHYKPIGVETPEFVLQHKPIICEGSMIELVPRLDTSHDVVFLGVRRDDIKGRPDTYQSTWLRKCQVLTPLYEYDYQTIWKMIDTLDVDVSPMYSQGYSSVGYNANPNELLKTHMGQIRHARELKNVLYERR